MPKQPSKKTGRPQVVTADVLKKLETAFALDATDEEACFYADISPRTLYNYQTANPEFEERKKALKQRPVLIARQTVITGIGKDAKLAMDYLKAKKRDEFATRQELEHSGEISTFNFTYVRPSDHLPADRQAGPGLAVPDRSDDA